MSNKSEKSAIQREIVNWLLSTGLFSNVSEREAILLMSGLDKPLLNLIVREGSPYDFTSNLVDILLHSDQSSDGNLALTVFFLSLKTQLGMYHHSKIDDLIVALDNYSSQPDSAYGTSKSSRAIINKTPSASGYNSEVVRELLNASFSDSEIVVLCFDHFHPVYDQFSSGMGKVDKIQRLIEYCERKLEMQTLLAEVERRNPNQYDRFKARLK